MHQTISIQSLAEKYIEPVISLHQLVLGDTVNSRLGPRHLEYLYRAMLQATDCFIAVAINESQPVGFISGALDLNAIKRLLLKSMPLEGWKNIAGRLIRHPSLFLEWVRGNQVSQPIFIHGKRIDPILTTIGVDPNFQGLGVGKKLVYELETFFRGHKVSMYRLDALKTNHAAQTFYASLGFIQHGKRTDSILYLKEII